jgi:hypothetical protein
MIQYLQNNCSIISALVMKVLFKQAPPWKYSYPWLSPYQIVQTAEYKKKKISYLLNDIPNIPTKKLND